MECHDIIRLGTTECDMEIITLKFTGKCTHICPIPIRLPVPLFQFADE